MASITQSLRRAKETGHLQLSNRGLSDFPEEATRLETVLTEEEKWWEVVPLKTIDIRFTILIKHSKVKIKLYFFF